MAMHSSLIGKIQKANRYVQEPDRVNFLQFSASFRGEHDTYTVSYSKGGWNCTCNFFGNHDFCSHTMAVQKLLGVMVTRGGSEEPASPEAAAAARV